MIQNVGIRLDTKKVAFPFSESREEDRSINKLREIGPLEVPRKRRDATSYWTVESPVDITGCYDLYKEDVHEDRQARSCWTLQ